MEPLMRLRVNGRLLALPTNIRQGWKIMEMANNVAYYDIATIILVKSLTMQAPRLFIRARIVAVS